MTIDRMGHASGAVPAEGPGPLAKLKAQPQQTPTPVASSDAKDAAAMSSKGQAKVALALTGASAFDPPAHLADIQGRLAKAAKAMAVGKPDLGAHHYRRAMHLAQTPDDYFRIAAHAHANGHEWMWATAVEDGLHLGQKVAKTTSELLVLLRTARHHCGNTVLWSEKLMNKAIRAARSISDCHAIQRCADRYGLGWYQPKIAQRAAELLF
jgi:hypothetical protein